MRLPAKLKCPFKHKSVGVGSRWPDPAVNVIKEINNYFQMEKFMYISILLFINVVFIFQPTKGSSHQTCNVQTVRLCENICDKSKTGCCTGSEEDSSWRSNVQVPSNIQYNSCSSGQCTVNGV